jgi:MFS family permease
VQGFLILVTLLVTGPLFDRGYARSLTCIGSILVVFGMMMTSLAHEYWQALLSQGFCIGFGHGCLFIVGVGQVSLTFKRRRWMAMGLGMSGGSVGELVQGYVKGLSWLEQEGLCTASSSGKFSIVLVLRGQPGQ